MATALAMYRARPWSMIVIALVGTLPSALLSTGGDLAYGVPTGARDQLLRLAAVAIPGFLLGQLCTAAAAILAMDLLNHRPGTASHALELVGVRFWPLCLVLLVVVAGVVAGLLLLIPGLVLAVLWLYAPIVSVAEGRGLGASLSRSLGLVRGVFWWTLGGFLLLQVTVALAAILAGTILGAPFTTLGGNGEILGVGVASLVVTTLAFPVVLLGIALMYLDRRVRTEGCWPSPGVQPPLP